jgi:hypothetical protein
VNDLDRYVLTPTHQGGQLALRHLGCGQDVALSGHAEPNAASGRLSNEPTLMELLVARHAHIESCEVY